MVVFKVYLTPFNFLNRWVINYRPKLEANFRTRKRKVADSWRIDDTYIKGK